MRHRTAIAALPARARLAPKFRPDIQALRALAVTLVVLTHLWPGFLTGGYVGVDVFFVISGYLITSHLMKEIRNTGRIRYGEFYARRARRLLPAALVVLSVGAVASMAFLPSSRWKDTAQESIASALYVENWFLAAKSVNYSAHNADATLAQHYWSLSVEEQFYLLWPLFLVAVAVLAARQRLVHLRLTQIMVGLVGAVSLLLCLVWTAASPNQAYFVTPVRVWEFCAGALAGLGAAGFNQWVGGRFRLRSLLAWGGLATIFLASILYTPQTAFPGHAALLPVAGTVAVILSGEGPGHWHDPLSPQKFMDSPPVQFLGNISYSLYLWHWPVIVLAPFVVGRPPGIVDQFAMLAISVLLGWASLEFIEKPTQRWPYFAGSKLRTLKVVVVMTAVAVGLSLVQTGRYAARQDEIQASAASEEGLAPGCSRPVNLEKDGQACGRFEDPVKVDTGEANSWEFLPPGCDPSVQGVVRNCSFGDGSGESVVLVGDSHAQQWLAAVAETGRKRNWNVSVIIHGGCPMADVEHAGFLAPYDEPDLCRPWKEAANAYIMENRPDLVFTSAYTFEEYVRDETGKLYQFEKAVPLMTEGFTAYWREWTREGIRVFPIVDNPSSRKLLSKPCLDLNRNDPLKCAEPRASALKPNPFVQAAEKVGDRVHVLDFTEYFCDKETCYSVVAGVPVFFDDNHLNRMFVLGLAPEFERRVESALGTSPSPGSTEPGKAD